MLTMMKHGNMQKAGTISANVAVESHQYPRERDNPQTLHDHKSRGLQTGDSGKRLRRVGLLF